MATSKAPARRRLVIVESPTKARTIAGYLGAGVRGRGEPRATSATCRSRASCPADMKKGPFGKFAVDVDNGFEAVLRRRRRQEEDGRAS